MSLWTELAFVFTCDTCTWSVRRRTDQVPTGWHEEPSPDGSLVHQCESCVLKARAAPPPIPVRTRKGAGP